MGKGDRKTRRGKIIKGKHGVSRPKKLRNREASHQNPGENKKAKKK